MAITLGQICNEMRTEIKASGSPSFDLDTKLLVANLLNCSVKDLLLRSNEILNNEQIASLRKVTHRRVEGEPIAYIVGERGFYKSTFKVKPGVLVPRPETEHLVEEALKRLSNFESQTIVDMGCGSGCIGLSLILERPQLQAILVDNSLEALQVARENSRLLGVEGRSHFLHMDVAELTDQSLQQFKLPKPQVIVANPPYIRLNSTAVEASVEKFEPKQALFSGRTGEEHIKQWAKCAHELLANPGVFICEIGYDQGQSLVNYYANQGHWSEAKVQKDYANHDRVLVLEKEESHG